MTHLLLLALAACQPDPTSPSPGGTSAPVDADGDGTDAQHDCDDNNAAIHPGAEEVAADQLDNDCDGAVDCLDSDLPWATAWEDDLEADQFAAFCEDAVCREVQGAVLVTNDVGTPPLACLAAAQLVFVTGTTGLTDLTGLEGLQSVEALLIHDNESLTTLDGLAGLHEVGGSVSVRGNPVLTSVPSMPHLGSVGRLELHDNPTLSEIGDIHAPFDVLSLADLPALVSLGGLRVQAAEQVEIARNAQLTTIDLHEATHVGELLLTDNPSLEALPSLDGLTTSPSMVVVAGNPRVPDLAPLAGIPWNPQSLALTIHDQPRIEDLAPLAGVRAVSDVVLTENNALRSLQGLDGLTEIKGDLVLVGNSAQLDLTALADLRTLGGMLSVAHAPLESLEGLEQLEEIGGIHLDNLPDLTTLAALSSVTEGYGALHLTDLPALGSLDGLQGFTRADYVRVEACDGLTSLSGLGLVEADGTVKIQHNQGLTSLDGLQGMAAVGESLEIESNPSLLALDGLEGMRSIGAATDFFGGHLFIHGNASLMDVSALHGLEHVEEDLSITDNPSLTAQAIGAVVSDIDHIGGTVTVDGNGGGGPR